MEGLIKSVFEFANESNAGRLILSFQNVSSFIPSKGELYPSKNVINIF
jgi:hypothetical protein